MADKCTWGNVEFSIHEITVTWSEKPGVYIFAGVVNNAWKAYYIGQCDSFNARCPLHERWQEARQLGATRVHARVVKDQSERDLLESNLIRLFQPPLNTQHR